ncbi:hypothetical protein J6590_077542 [Homalodisca vitripennis]|nr:hypothetical protein J6590_077542 [Homalodisca vitripennis]
MTAVSGRLMTDHRPSVLVPNVATGGREFSSLAQRVKKIISKLLQTQLNVMLCKNAHSYGILISPSCRDHFEVAPDAVVRDAVQG